MSTEGHPEDRLLRRYLLGDRMAGRNKNALRSPIRER